MRIAKFLDKSLRSLVRWTFLPHEQIDRILVFDVTCGQRVITMSKNGESVPLFELLEQGCSLCWYALTIQTARTALRHQFMSNT
jgi:hypothetical protein